MKVSASGGQSHLAGWVLQGAELVLSTVCWLIPVNTLTGTRPWNIQLEQPARAGIEAACVHYELWLSQAHLLQHHTCQLYTTPGPSILLSNVNKQYHAGLGLPHGHSDCRMAAH